MYFYVKTVNDTVYEMYFENFEINHKNINMYKFKITFEHLYLLNKDCNNFVYVHIPLNFYYTLYDINDYVGCKLDNYRMLEIDLNLLRSLKRMRIRCIC